MHLLLSFTPVWLPGYPVNDRFVVRSPEGVVPDTIPESMSMVIHTTKGLVVVSGCGHAGLVNTLEHARAITRPAPIHAAIGGFHLAPADDEQLDWTAGKLVDLELSNFVGAHCTGIEPVFRFRELADLGRSHCVIGAVGASFSLEQGIAPGLLAR